MTHQAEAQIAVRRAHRCAQVALLFTAVFAVSGFYSFEARFGDKPLGSGEAKPWTLRLERGDLAFVPGVDQPGLIGAKRMAGAGWNWTAMPSRLGGSKIVGRASGVNVPLMPLLAASGLLVVLRRRQARQLCVQIQDEVSSCSDMQGVGRGPLAGALADSAGTGADSGDGGHALMADGPPSAGDSAVEDVLKRLEAA